VVIGIIAILASLMLPALRHARNLARQAACLNQQRQIYLATALYEQDFNNLMPHNRIPKKAFGFGTPTWWGNRIISLGLLAWYDYIEVQEVLTCTDTVTVPLKMPHWAYPHLADHPTRDNWHNGHRPAFALPMKGKRNFLASGYHYGGTSGYAFRRRGNMLIEWQSNDFLDYSKVTLGTINCKTIMVCNQFPGDPYETCHQERGSNLLFYDGSAKWGDFQGVPRRSHYSFDYIFAGVANNTTMWAWADAQY